MAVIHESFPGLPLPVQILVRLPSGLKLCDALGRDTVFVWLLISSEETHPAMGTAVEFGKLMAGRRFRKEALATENVEALEVAYHAALEREVHFRAHIPEELRPTGKLFGGLRADIARRRPRYLSDYVDGLTPKTLASVFFLFFACFAPAVAFGGLLSELTGGAIGAIEMIVATALAGVAYAIFSAQPLTILGSTGPIIIFMGILFELTQKMGIPYIPTLAWVGLWTSLFLLILAITDASTLIRFFTRFTDDTFAALISVIFIVEALRDVIGVFLNHKVKHDTALLSLILALGTFLIARSLSLSAHARASISATASGSSSPTSGRASRSSPCQPSPTSSTRSSSRPSPSPLILGRARGVLG
ncbi:MAG: hypothetical protein KAI47_12255 [Deltaproteobacteria bacterium]|nr:hypothetical protein [Deltaproteobacteria bacterium]